MSVMSKLKGFLTRHKIKFLIGGVAITGSILFTKFAQQKLIEWQEKETIDFLERNRKQSHFESIGRTCNQTISNLSSTLTSLITKTVNTDCIIEDLKSHPTDKIKLWNELKVYIIMIQKIISHTDIHF